MAGKKTTKCYTKKEKDLLEAFNDGRRYNNILDKMFRIMKMTSDTNYKSKEWQLQHKRYMKLMKENEKLLWKYTKGL